MNLKKNERLIAVAITICMYLSLLYTFYQWGYYQGTRNTLVEIDEYCGDLVVETEEQPMYIIESIDTEPTEVDNVEPVVEVEETYLGVLKPSNLTSEELEKGLLRDLKNYADVFIRAEEETGVNAVFLSSIAGYESGWSTSCLARTKNNLFGWTSTSGFRTFESKEECIMYVAHKIKTNYLSPEGCYFNGYDVEDVNVCYNGRDTWTKTVYAIMSEINHRIEKENLV